MSRSVSILSVVVVMTVTVLATVAVAFAVPNEGSNGQAKVPICHKGHEITVAAPAVQAHIKHGDPEPKNSATEPENGITELENADTELENPEDACETAGAPPEEPSEDATLTTEATDTATLPGGTISDVATLGTDVPDGTDGDIEFKLYGPFTTAPTPETAATDCVADNLVDSPSYSSTVSVDDHTAAKNPYTSASYTPTLPGIYQWTASFTPDSGQDVDPSGEIGCGEEVEQSVVDDATSTAATEQYVTLAGENVDDANPADPATDTTNTEGTIQNDNTSAGTDNEDDDLYGDSSANKLFGRHGNDYLEGGQGRDRMVAGTQGDYVNGADGIPRNDVINGGIGTDYCVGDVGDEFMNCDGNVVKVPVPSESGVHAEAGN